MNYRTWILALVILLSFASCSTIKKYREDHDDGEIIALIVDSICDNGQEGMFILSSETTNFEGTFAPNGLEASVRESLIARNTKSVRLPPVDQCEKLRRVDARDINMYLKGPGQGDLQERWSALYKHFPDIDGVMFFSLPGYSAQRNVAVIQVTGSCGPLCGNGFFWTLRRESGHWRIEKAEEGWTN